METVFESASPDLGVSVAVVARGDTTTVAVTLSPDTPLTDDAVLHWGVGDWKQPLKSSWPPGTAPTDGKGAVRTPLVKGATLTATFPSASLPANIVFVINDGETWIKNPATGGDWRAPLAPPSAAALLARVIEAETPGRGNWSLMQRFGLAADLVDDAGATGAPGAGALLAWLRLSSLRQLPWYGGSCYQSKDAAHTQKMLAERVAALAASAPDGDSRRFARAILATLPRGGGGGDDIRMGILHIMRDHGIREGHRPGIEEPFLEQWHQKLHTNTTPDDVAICEAYMAFLDTGSMETFWATAWDRGGLTAEDLATMDHPLTATPLHLPHLKGAFEHYLTILKRTHGGASLDAAVSAARGCVGGDLAWALGDLLDHRHEWWVPGKLVELRGALRPLWTAPGASRDLALLDVALEEFLRVKVEAVDPAALPPPDRIALLQLLLDSASLDAVAGEEDDVVQCAALWRAVAGIAAAGDASSWTCDAAQAVLAASQRTELALAARADRTCAAVGPAAAAFAAVGVDAAYLSNFGEEVARGDPLFPAARLLRVLAADARAVVGVGDWLVVATGEGGAAVGRALLTPTLGALAGASYGGDAVVVFADEVDGSEDVPIGVTAVLTPSIVDALAHVALRARAQGVLLATCLAPDAWEKMADFGGSSVSVAVTNTGGVKVGAAAAGAAAAARPAAGVSSPPPLVLPKAPTVDAWVLAEADYVVSGAVGGKAANLAGLRGRLPEGVAIPPSVALPFRTFDRVLADPANAGAALELAAICKRLDAARSAPGLPAADLAAARDVVAARLAPPPALAAAVAAAAATAGVPIDEANWLAVWSAVCGVWASVHGDRAWLSRRAARVPDAALAMAVLLQEVAPPDYAFEIGRAHV